MIIPINARDCKTIISYFPFFRLLRRPAGKRKTVSRSGNVGKDSRRQDLRLVSEIFQTARGRHD